MKRYFLTEIITKDKLIHQGIFSPSSRKATKGTAGRAILWIHGLTSTFYSHIPFFEALVGEYGFAAFNNRGHDLIAGIKKVDRRKKKGYVYVNGGAGYEKFEECILDIDAGLDFLKDQGFSDIILAGHSTGANKVCYYAATKQNRFVRGIVLLSPTSDRLVFGVSPKKRKKELSNMNRFMLLNKGDELMVGYHFFPLTPRRYVSMFTPHSNEDTFDYGDPKPSMMYFSQIRKPILVVFAGDDESADRPIEQIKKVFDAKTNASRYQSVIIPDALHGFHEKEHDVADAIMTWIKTI